MNYKLTYFRKKISGFSLVELMIAMVISLFLTLGLFTMFRMSSTNVTTTTHFNELQENGRIALSLMERDVSQTGFFGDITGINLIAGANTRVDAIPLNAAEDCIGAGMNNASIPVISPSPFRVIWGYENDVSAYSFRCLNSVTKNTDVLQIKRVIGPVTNTTDQENQYYVGTTQNEAIFFKGDQPTPNKPRLRFWQYAHHIYYIRESDDIPSLRRRRLVGVNMNGDGGGDQQLVEGIENMRILYGIDQDFDNSADIFLPAEDVTDLMWSGAGDDRIIAIQVSLLVRSINKDKSYTNKNTYKLGDKDIAAFDDNYRRKVVMTTISLDNLMVNRN
ncbi:pilus assembly protein PilW [Parashewanella curva]|uniref:Pilus assembly protein PilW n=1 Tax=Parashewanella curva TaxID=2338552 RepID=A0A3L8Q1A9_9GAMM|nr:PilW family protein [Parashewanella curva]RLV61426.1 pilus assembly protein PilW [Parashewanella curva]